MAGSNGARDGENIMEHMMGLRRPTQILLAAYGIVGVLGFMLILELFFNVGIFMAELLFAYALIYGVVGFGVVFILHFVLKNLKRIEDGGLTK